MQEMQEMWVRSLGQEDPLEEETVIFLPGKSMDRRAWWAIVRGVVKELDTTEQLTLSLSFTRYSCIQWLKIKEPQPHIEYENG